MVIPRLRVAAAAAALLCSAAVGVSGAPSALAGTVSASSAAQAPQSNDPMRYDQWGLTKLQAENVWAVHSAAGQTVAVIDTGVDVTNPDLAGVVLPGADFVNGHGVQSPGDGSDDTNGHGTQVAGIIAAVANNGIGGAGLAQGVHILPVNVLGDVEVSSADMAAGIRWATAQGVGVINISLGSPSWDSADASAVADAQAAGIVVVAAAGNSGSDGNPVMYPAAYPGVVAVAATDFYNVAPSWSEHGSYVSIAAPGLRIGSTLAAVSGGGYGTASGTSSAAPFVAATAALLRAAAPTWSAAQVISDMLATADDIDTPGRDDLSGAGLVDPLAALRVVIPAPPTVDPTPAPPVTSPVTPPSAPPAPPTVGHPAEPAVAHLAAPGTVSAAGAAVTVRAAASTGTGAPLHGTVSFCTAPFGGHFSCTPRVKETSGRWTVVLHPRTGTEVMAKFRSAGVETDTAAVRLSVRPVVHLRGGVHTVTATLTPAAHLPVVLQRAVKGTWAVVVRRTAGAAPLTVASLPAGTYRLVVPASYTLAGATSATVTVA